LQVASTTAPFTAGDPESADVASSEAPVLS
jgi:hypothetical protein